MIEAALTFQAVNGDFTKIAIHYPYGTGEDERRNMIRDALATIDLIRDEAEAPPPDPEYVMWPFQGKCKGLTLGDVAQTFPQDLVWLAYQASSLSHQMREAARQVAERYALLPDPTATHNANAPTASNGMALP
jgi:hypothetical protein